MRHLPLLLLAACDPDLVVTDEGQLGLSADAVAFDNDDGDVHVLAGTELCVTVSGNGDRPSGDYDPVDCFTQTIDGPVELSLDADTWEPSHTCLAFTEPGTVDWTFTPTTCVGEDYGYAPVADHVAIVAVDGSDVVGDLPFRLEEAAEGLEGQEGFTLVRPAVWLPAAGDPLRLVAGQAFDVLPALLTGDDEVAWWDATIEVEGAGTAEPLQDRAGFRLRATTAGESATLYLVTGDTRIELGTIEGVDDSALASMEIAYATVSTEDGVGAPWAARAVVKDLEGNLVFAAPVQWRFSPMVPLAGTPNGMPSADYVTFGSECTDPATTYGEQRGTLSASIGLLSASAVITWTPRLQAEPVEEWEAPEECQDACGCATGGATPAGLATLVGLLALTRRRRA